MTKLIYCIKISKLDGVSLSLTLPGQGQCVALVIILPLDGMSQTQKLKIYQADHSKTLVCCGETQDAWQVIKLTVTLAMTLK